MPPKVDVWGSTSIVADALIVHLVLHQVVQLQLC